MTMWKPDIRATTDPIYLAIAKAIAADVGSGRLKPGERLPTHRRLAEEINVSIGTVTRGYVEAVRRGVVRGETGRGTFVRTSASDEPGPTPDLSGNADLIDLSMNYPMHCEDPDLGAALATLAERADVSRLLRYQSAHTQPRHLEAGAHWMRGFGAVVDADSLIITAGGQHALTVILSVITKPGDLILCDQLTYPGLIAVAQLRDLRVQGIAMDEVGMCPDALLAACRQRKAQVLYCMPTLHNPTLAILTAQRRQRLCEIAREYDLLIIEDDVHRPLIPDAPPPLRDLAPERSFFVASTSKIIAGGLRVAYVVAPPFAQDQLKHGVWATVWMLPPLTVELATMWIEDGTAQRTAERKRAEAGARVNLAGEMLEGFSYCSHPRAYNIWLDLPPEWASAEFAIESRRRGVAVTPCSMFAVPGADAPNAVRVCLGAAENRKQLRCGLQVIAGMLRHSECCTSPCV